MTIIDAIISSEECPGFYNGDNIVAFKSHLNIFSNYYPCDITYKEKTFRSLEHAYQWEKAMYLGKDDIAQSIIEAEHAGAARAIARDNIDPDDAKGWEEKSADVMWNLIVQKAECHVPFKHALMETGDCFLAEATSHPLWASGLDVQTTKKTKPEFWPGKNLLGEQLMELRSKLQNVEAEEDETDVDDEQNSESLLQDAQRFDETQDDTHKDTPEETFTQEWPTVQETKTNESQGKALAMAPKSVVSKMKDSKIIQYMIKKRKPSSSPPKEKGAKQKKDIPSIEENEMSHHIVSEIAGKHDSGTMDQNVNTKKAPT